MQLFSYFMFPQLCVVVSQCATVPQVTSCTNSHQCGADMCCRAADGHVITNQEMGGFNPFFPGGGHENGTCSTQKAQKGEVCDSDCSCDSGELDFSLGCVCAFQ